MNSRRLKTIQYVIMKGGSTFPLLYYSTDVSARLAHIGDQVFGLAVTDIIQSRCPHLQVGPTSVCSSVVVHLVFKCSPKAIQKVRDRVKCGDTLAEM